MDHTGLDIRCDGWTGVSNGSFPTNLSPYLLFQTRVRRPQKIKTCFLSTFSEDFLSNSLHTLFGSNLANNV